MKIDNVMVQEAVKELPKTKMNTDRAADVQKNSEHKKLEDVLKIGALSTERSTDKHVQDGTPLDVAQVEELVGAFNDFMVAFDQKMKFSVHEEINQVSVQIIDTESDEIIREIPSQGALELAAKIKEFVGVLVDKFA